MDKDKLQITTSLVCNNRCVFCVDDHLDDRNLKIKLDCEKNILKNLKLNQDKTQAVLFTSGEPTLNRKLLEYIKIAKDLKYKDISIITNGRRLRDETFCKKMLDTGIKEISVSIHGSNGKIHDSITRAKGSFRETAAGLTNLIRYKKKYQLDLSVHYTINKKNYADIYDFIKLIVSLNGIDRIIFNAVRPYGRARTNFDKVVPAYAAVGRQFKKAINKYQALNNQNDLIINIIDIPPCVLPGCAEYIGQLEKINITNYHFENEKDDNWLEERAKHKRCSQCKYNDYCRGVYEYYIKKRGWSEFIPCK